MFELFNKKKSLAKKFFLDYAKREIGLIGMTPGSKVYRKVMNLVKTFHDQDFDPAMKPSIVHILGYILRCKPLTECQHNDFSIDVSAVYGAEQGKLLQCSRCLNMFSKDNGVTWYDYYAKENDAKHSCGGECKCDKPKKKLGFTKYGKQEEKK